MVNSKEIRLDLALQAGLSTERFPETSLEATIAESALAKELENLSMDDHEKHLFELHGISAIPEEDSQMLAKALDDLQEELDKMPEKAKDAYEQAKFLNAAYVNDAKFRLMFLRCHEFDIPTTAKTIAYHFNVKKELFGDGEILARNIQQADLSPLALQVVRNGSMQLLPQRDASGRAVLLVSFDGYLSDSDDTLAMAHAFWYVGMSTMLLDEETQKRGLVAVCFHYDESTIPIFQGRFASYMAMNKLEVAVPFRNGGWHYCYPSGKGSESAMIMFTKGIQLFYPIQERLKLRAHTGTHEEIQFELQTFGIPMDDCPFRADGTWSTKFHMEWLQGLRAQEEEERAKRKKEYNIVTASTATVTILMIPTKSDVLFGKNARARDHAGNMRAHALVEEYFEAYESADKGSKTEIANAIITSIKQSGGRFLKQANNAGWEEVADTVARQKIAHWCRHLRHKKTTDALMKKDTNTVSLVASEPTLTAAPTSSIKRMTPTPPLVPDEDIVDLAQQYKRPTTQATNSVL